MYGSGIPFSQMGQATRFGPLTDAEDIDVAEVVVEEVILVLEVGDASTSAGAGAEL